MRVIVQEPAAVSNFSVLPKLDASASGQDGLRYHSADLGAQSMGKRLPISVRYTKTDARTSTQILPPKTPGPEPAPTPALASPAAFFATSAFFVAEASLVSTSAGLTLACDDAPWIFFMG